MKLFRRDFFLFIGGVLSLGLLGHLVGRRLTRRSPPSMPEETPGDFVLPEEAYRPEHRLSPFVFSVNRKGKTVLAHDEASGELLWESRGEGRFIVPGAAFPLDLTPEGELWVANVGRKRLEQLDPQTGRFIASWEPSTSFGGCCNPVRFAVLSGGRVVTMEKGVRRACLYKPSGELEQIVTDELSDSEFDYFLYRKDGVVCLDDARTRKHWEVS